MKILHIINSFAIGGAEVLLLNVAEELKRQGHDVHILCLSEGHENIRRRAIQKNISWHTLKNPKYISIYEMLRYLNSVGPFEVCHTHLYPAFLYGAFVKMAGFAKGLIHTEHDTTNNRRKWWLKPFDAALYLPVDRVIAISETVSSVLCSWLPSVRNKTAVVFNCVNPSYKKGAMRRTSTLRIVCVGRLVEKKNILVQLHALTLVDGVHIDYIGEGPMLEQLKSISTELGVGSKVRFLGAVDNMEGIYRHYDALVHSSKIEGFGLVVAEAMSAGIPVIVGQIPGVQEVAADLGIYFDVEEPESLADKLRYMLSLSEEKRLCLGEALVKRSEVFSIAHHVDQLVALYLGVVDPSVVRPQS